MNCNLFAVNNTSRNPFLVVLHRETISLINIYSRMQTLKLQNSYPTLKKK